METLARLTELHAARTPDRAAIVCGARVSSWAMLHERTLRAVGVLRAHGIGPGGRVGWLGLNHDDFAVVMAACWRVGAVLVAVNVRLVAREIAFIVEDAGVALLFVAGDVAGPASVPTIDVASDWAGGDPDPACHPARPDDVALQLYTSGTTGFPKGALLTHANLLGVVGKGALTGEAWGRWSAADVALVAMPLFHIGGCGWLLHAMVPGATSVILPRPDARAIADAVAAHRVTKLFVVPAVLAALLEVGDADLSSVTAVLYGASPIPLDTLRRAVAALPEADFVQCYGATETGGTVVYLPPADHFEGSPRMAGCGKPYPGNAVEIRRTDGSIAATGEVGEIALRSVSVMVGYHRRPDDTAKAIVDGWYLTGDAGFVDADGYLTIHDRVKDMIVSGAENIYPAEVESALHDHPCVADCAVIGIPDARWGEAVKAIVVRRGPVDEAALIAFARTRIAGFKVPKSIDFVDVLPRNASGKLLKRELRAPFWPADGRQVG